MLQFRGVIRHIRYQPTLGKTLKSYSISDFDINTVQTSGLVRLRDHELGFSKWVSPKRTRSYPFERIYNTYHLPKKVTVIPVLKDEGVAGDCDRINFITLSWMNLTNVYIILAWYDQAYQQRSRPDKITRQLFEPQYVKQKLEQISTYHQTALHWNIQHFEDDFAEVYRRAIERYETIATKTNVVLHSSESHWRQLERYQTDGRFDPSLFRQMSLSASFDAAKRELATQQALESLVDGAKAYFSLTDFLGGEYHLTADEVFLENGKWIIQESKHASQGLPALADLKDALFQLLLFSNLDQLYFEERAVEFIPRLKITGMFRDQVILPASSADIQNFLQANQFSPQKTRLILALNREAELNPLLQIHFEGANGVCC